MRKMRAAYRRAVHRAVIDGLHAVRPARAAHRKGVVPVVFHGEGAKLRHGNTKVIAAVAVEHRAV